MLSDIEQYQTIVIFRHKRPDFDAVGSQTGLSAFLKLNFPNKSIYAFGDKDFEPFSFIGKIDKEKKINVNEALCLVVDTANIERVEGEISNFEKVIKIDHHPDLDKYADYSVVEDYRSSTSELLADFFHSLIQKDANFKINSEIAQSLFIGIYGDTGGFKFPNTKQRTFEMVAFLRGHLNNYEEITLKLREESESFLKFLGQAYNSIIIENEVGYLKFDKEAKKKIKLEANDVSKVVNYLGVFDNIQSWVVFNEFDSFIRVNLRSKGSINVSELANHYGGGGHFNASGASINDWKTSDEIISELKKITIREK